MDLIAQLKEKRAKLADEVKIFLDDAEKRGTLTAAENRQAAEYSADLKALDDRIRELEDAQKEQRDLDDQRAPYDHIVRPAVTPSLARSRKESEEEVRAFLNRETNFLDVSFEGIELHRNVKDGTYEVRDLSVGSGTGGGNTVPTTFARDLYQHLVDSSGIRQTNATVRTTPDGTDLVIPKTVSHGTAAIVGEGSAIAENDPTFNKVTLGAWKYGELIEVTNELVTDSGVDLLGYLASQAGRALGYASGADFMTGNGTNKPLGVFAAAGTAVTGATGGTGVPSVANLIDMYYSVPQPYRDRGYWVMRDATAAYIRKLTAASSAPEQWADSLQDGQPSRILGRPVITSPFAPAMGTPATPIAFGDFTPYYIRDVQGVRFERSDDFKFANDMVAFRAILRTDGDLVDLTGAIQLFAGPST